MIIILAKDATWQWVEEVIALFWLGKNAVDTTYIFRSFSSTKAAELVNHSVPTTDRSYLEVSSRKEQILIIRIALIAQKNHCRSKAGYYPE